ncbi:hypothetical protein [Azospirillum argentinense]|uniref:Uncharacterized protein n=1 Tax=Azospirillum brasilense TaxID=192 RepID=A0A4D8Q743_AZOBR|nr:hypothetical protein [Azospirillum argentinense]QCO05878.1 hypothetical protein D3867_28840 [Azospirillum argentinense]
MSEADDGLAELEDALALVRGLWSQQDVSERTVAWAMVIEAVDRLVALHGPARTGRMLEGLVQEVRGLPMSRALQ